MSGAAPRRRAIGHGLQALAVARERFGRALAAGKQLQRFMRPPGQVRVQSVVNPEPFAPVGHHAEFAQAREVTRDLRLDFLERMHQFAHAQLILDGEQGKAPQSGRVGESAEEVSRRNGHAP